MDSPRGASAWRELALRLLVVALAIAIGLVLQRWLTLRLAELDELAKTDLLGARAELATLLRLMAVAVFGLTGAVGASVIAACRRALALEIFPPPGRWSWGGRRRAATGPAARRLARVGIGLGASVLALSAAGGGLLWWAASVVAACRAGVR